MRRFIFAYCITYTIFNLALTPTFVQKPAPPKPAPIPCISLGVCVPVCDPSDPNCHDWDVHQLPEVMTTR